MSLILHCGAKPISEKQVKAIKATCKTKTHEALPHGEFIDMTRSCLSDLGIEAGEGTYGVTPCGEDMFGFIELPRNVEFNRIKAIKETFKVPFPYSAVCQVMVRAVRDGIIPPGMLSPVMDEWEESENPAQATAFQGQFDANRLVQAFAHVNQKNIGHRAKTDFAVFNRLAIRSKEFVDLLRDKLPAPNLQADLFPDALDSRYIIGLRNSNRRRFTAGWLLGEAPFICDNLAFMGEVQCDHKHTLNIRVKMRKRVMEKLTELVHGDLSRN
jgi:hypothetical protein